MALVLPTGSDVFFAFFGTILAGAVLVPLYPPVRLGRRDEYHARTALMIQVSGARAVITDRRIRRLLGEAIARSRPRFGCLGASDLRERGSASIPRRMRTRFTVSFAARCTSLRIPSATSRPEVLPDATGVARHSARRRWVTVAGVALGLIVDDTIHILHRVTAAQRAGKDATRVVSDTLYAVGRPVLVKSLAGAAGFGAFALSPFPPARYLGALIACGHDRRDLQSRAPTSAAPVARQENRAGSTAADGGNWMNARPEMHRRHALPVSSPEPPGRSGC